MPIDNKRPKVRVDFRLDPDLLQELDDWCWAQPARTTRTGALEGAIKLLLKTYPRKRRKK